MGGEVNSDDNCGESSSDCTDYCFGSFVWYVSRRRIILYVNVCGFADAFRRSRGHPFETKKSRSR